MNTETAKTKRSRELDLTETNIKLGKINVATTLKTLK